MLILTRKPGESLYIGDNIKIIIVEIKGNQIRVGIDAPTEMRIYREEIYLQILEENKKAAEAAQSSEAGLESLGKVWQGMGEQRPASKLGASLDISSLRSTPVKSSSPEVVVRKKKQKQNDE